MSKTSTTEQLRADIDRGRTGDKVPAFDPAAAPLGTDEEAAGTPIPPRAIDQARAHENFREARMPSGQGAQPGSSMSTAAMIAAASRTQRKSSFTAMLILAAIAAAVCLALWLLATA